MSKDLLWKYYEKDLDKAFSHEESRQKITTIIMAVSGTFLTIAGYDKIINYDDLILTIIIIFLGVFGIVFNAKYYERYCFHYERARKYRAALEELVKDVPFRNLREEADLLTKSNYSISNKIRLNKLWLFLNAIVSVLGVILTIIALKS